MEKSKASWSLRFALKERSRRLSRRWRRREVVVFYGLMLLSLARSLGSDHHTWRDFWWVIYGVLWAIQRLSYWSRPTRLVGEGLDDRAQLEHGVNFDQLSDAEQKEILRRRRFGRFYSPDPSPDERQEALRLRANESAFRFLRVALLCFAAAYWAVYFWVPTGGWRDTLMDSPVVILWLVVFVISLPDIIVMWTEPDAIGEPKVVLNEAQTQ